VSLAGGHRLHLYRQFRIVSTPPAKESAQARFLSPQFLNLRQSSEKKE
jgi:hypothetical protein